MPDPHWTLTAIHLGELTQAEWAVVMREIEDHMLVVLRRYNLLPAHQPDYCLLEALCAEYDKARAARPSPPPANFNLADIPNC